ncbi:MAG: hypothetical protein QNJ70_01325 [Xenococcaceae cyanobacterium MO_207.B15]|nr:hypothetical protein [Xenococcaceae cyanobacterium MO_207.B15]
MLANSNSPEDRLVSDQQNVDGEDSPSPLLPRSAWNSNLAFLRVIFKVKQVLDRIELIENKSD